MRNFIDLENKIAEIVQNKSTGDKDIITEEELEYLIGLGLEISTIFSFGTLLHYAVIIDSMSLANLLVRKNIDINTPAILEEPINQKFSTSLETTKNIFLSPLYLAYRGKEQKFFEFFLKLGANPNIYSGQETHIMYEVVRRKDAHSAKLLIEAGVDLNKIPDNEGVSIITHACIFGNPEIVKIFLAAGANPNIKNFEGETLLEELCSREKTELIEIIFDHLRSRNQTHLKEPPKIKNHEKTIFLESLELLAKDFSHMDDQIAEFRKAVYSSDLEKVENLIKSGINGKKLAKFDKIIFHLACVKGNKEIVQLLLNCGIDVNMRILGGMTALSVCNSLRIIEIILEHIIEKSIIYTDSCYTMNTPLHYLSLLDNPKLVSAFLERETKINSLNAYGRTPLDLAASTGKENFFFALLEKGANPGLEAEGKPLLIRPCLKGYVNIVAQLVKLDVNLESKNRIGRNALHAAAFAGHPQVIDLLVSSGAIIDAQDNFGLTPLHLAIENSNVQTVRSLLKAGASLEIKDNSGRDALKIAKAAQNKEVKTIISKTIISKTVKNQKKEEEVKFQGVYDNIFENFLLSKTVDEEISSQSPESAISPDRVNINIAFPVSPSVKSRKYR